MTNLINHLKQLDKDATPAPWRVDVFVPEPKGLVLAHVKEDDTFEIVCKFPEDKFMATPTNHQSIAYLRNNLPAIISLLEAGEKLRAASHRTFTNHQRVIDNDLGNYTGAYFVRLRKEAEEDRATLTSYDTIKKELE